MNRMNRTLKKRPFRGWRWLSILILIFSYSFLAYKLLTFDQYNELFAQWKQMPVSHFWWLAAVFVLLPVNWLLETYKWQLLTSNIQQINFKTSLKAVLAGISAGFFTPNRVGEFVGRLMFLNTENRKAGLTLSVVNSLTQNLIMTLCGIPACILFYTSTFTNMETNINRYLILLTVCLLLLGLFYFLFPKLSQRFKQTRFSNKLKAFTDCLSDFRFKDLIQIILVSLFRYMVFCVQFFFMLRFFGIELSSWQALIAIPTNYLFVTFTPTLAFSEATVRSSFAVLTIGAFSPQIVNIALAGMCIWMVNFVIPMLVGSVVMVKKNTSTEK
jgi:uncharacterized membrane protein YbhN (UPF0104 family)